MNSPHFRLNRYKSPKVRSQKSNLDHVHAENAKCFFLAVLTSGRWREVQAFQPYYAKLDVRKPLDRRRSTLQEEKSKIEGLI